MKSHIDLQGRALLTIPVSCSPDGPESPIEFWVDIGFTGDLVLPIHRINELRLRESSVVGTAMADGRELSLDSFVAWVNWFGELEEVEVIASSGPNVLLGVRLLLGRRLVVDYHTLHVDLE